VRIVERLLSERLSAGVSNTTRRPSASVNACVPRMYDGALPPAILGAPLASDTRRIVRDDRSTVKASLRRLLSALTRPDAADANAAVVPSALIAPPPRLSSNAPACATPGIERESSDVVPAATSRT